MIIDGPQAVQRVKKRVLGLYIGALERLDPQVATHILESNRQFFLAGQAFFAAEAGHAAKAIDRMARRRQEQEKKPAE